MIMDDQCWKFQRHTRKKLMTLQPRTQNALYIFAVNQNIVMYTHLWLINKFYCENTCVSFSTDSCGVTSQSIYVKGHQLIIFTKSRHRLWYDDYNLAPVGQRHNHKTIHSVKLRQSNIATINPIPCMINCLWYIFISYGASGTWSGRPSAR